ncbi:Prefoldin [Penicillium verrucosum]|uniref:Prefoldin n=1 Tax=Penicillium verrucosum TaxID=60171 RepID=UPI0025450C29|nr:Prefoldin [Penicillium verrucosum]KAJ5945364.1 Prefoldin [Penicillium verrucosum]
MVQPRMVSQTPPTKLKRDKPHQSRSSQANLANAQLTKADETSANDENEVRREDQEKINRFSRLHQRQTVLDEQLKGKQKDKEDLEEVSMELELADEDELVPYKIGDSFFQLPLSDAQGMLSASTEKIDTDVTKLEDSIGELREEMQQLKVALYARFGRSINLET